MRRNIASERFSKLSSLINSDVVGSVLLWFLFVLLCLPIYSFELIQVKNYGRIVPVAGILLVFSIAGAIYISHYQKRIIKNHARAAALTGVFLLLLLTAKMGAFLMNQPSWCTGTAIAVGIILSVAYDQRFALGMGILYCLFACFVSESMIDIRLFMTMSAGVFTCCFCLKEIRTRMKLLEVSALAATVVFTMSVLLDFLTRRQNISDIWISAGYHAGATFIVGLMIQSLLPLIEKTFRIATSMTLLDYSDANQPLLKRLAMEAPGTFSHGLLLGSVAEAAAEAIGRNGLLCRVGAYYHDIGKLNKPGYFVENEVGDSSKHKELSPAMSQLVISGHVKDGIEMAKEYGLPAVLRQFIETHHGTTLIEYFYNEAKKKRSEKESEPSESEFRYPGPKPRTKEAAIVMLTDAVESAVRSLSDITATRIEAVVHNMAMKRLQDGQFDECDLSLRELSEIEKSLTKSLAAHYHGRISYPKQPDIPDNMQTDSSVTKTGGD